MMSGPYLGGGVVGYNFLPAGESTYHWARQMGYGSLQISGPTASLSTPRSIVQLSRWSGRYVQTGRRHQPPTLLL